MFALISSSDNHRFCFCVNSFYMKFRRFVFSKSCIMIRYPSSLNETRCSNLKHSNFPPTKPNLIISLSFRIISCQSINHNEDNSHLSVLIKQSLCFRVPKVNGGLSKLGALVGACKAVALHRFSAYGRPILLFIHFCNLKRCRLHKIIKKLHNKILNNPWITFYGHDAYIIVPRYVNILNSLDYITGILYASCNATGLISTFAGLALHFCIKLNTTSTYFFFSLLIFEFLFYPVDSLFSLKDWFYVSPIFSPIEMYR